jgi:hypothetical protein
MSPGPDLPSIHDFYSTLNWLPTVNGESGYTPPVYSDLVAATQPNNLLSDQTLAALQGMGVRWLVWHLHDESMPLDLAQWQKLQPQLDNSKFLKLAYSDANDRVYELLADPWMSKLGNMLPTNSGLVVSDLRRQQPLLTELTETILQNGKHPLYGNDRAGYRFLQPPPLGQPVPYGLFASTEDPTPYGFSPDEVIWNNQWLKLYKRKANLLDSYDVNHDPTLMSFSHIQNRLSLRLEVEGVRFQDKQFLGSGQRLIGKGQLELTFSSLVAQTITLGLPDGTEQKLNLTPGLNIWRSGPLTPSESHRDNLINDTTLKIDPNSGQDLYLNRVDLVTWTDSNTTGLTNNAKIALLNTTTQQQGQTFVSSFTVYAPGDASTHYNFTLDIYKRPWGSANSGHFGNWTVALTGQNHAQLVQFRFDPTTRQTSVTVDQKPADIGAQPLDTRDGPYSAYISLWQLGSKDATQVGVSHLYDFSLNSGIISEVALLPEREVVLVPPLVVAKP